MRLIAEELGGERGGQPVFSDIGFSLGETCRQLASLRSQGIAA